MKKTICVKLPNESLDLCTQIYYIVSIVIKAIKEKIPIVVLDNFRSDTFSSKKQPFSEIIDLDFLNRFLETYSVAVIDKKNATIEIESVEYGTPNLKLDIKKEFITRLQSYNSIYIKNGFYWNDLKGDPFHGVSKKIYLKYKINEYIFLDEFDENNEEFKLNLDKSEEIYEEDVFNTIENEYELFNFLLKNIVFNEQLVNMSEFCILSDKSGKMTLTDLVSYQKKINILNLNFNDVIRDDTNSKILNYLKMLDPNDMLIIIDEDKSSAQIIQFLKTNNFNYYTIKKNIFEGSEQEKVLSLLVGIKCSGSFIGYYDRKIQKNKGLNYFIINNINKKVTTYLINV